MGTIISETVPLPFELEGSHLRRLLSPVLHLPPEAVKFRSDCHESRELVKCIYLFIQVFTFSVPEYRLESRHHIVSTSLAMFICPSPIL